MISCFFVRLLWRLAAKRFVTAFRQEHPHLKAHCLRSILGAKAGDHKALFKRAATDPNTRSLTQTTPTNKGTVTHHYRWLHEVPLNDSHPDLKVNVLHDTETKTDERPRNWSWVTDLSLHEDNLYDVMRAARARWRIEHQTSKTLKIDGDHFEHNFGHGNQHLVSIMVSLCLLAFLIDQVVEHCCGMFRQALKKQERKLYLRDAMMVLFRTFLINRSEAFYRALYEPRKGIDAEAVLNEP